MLPNYVHLIIISFPIAVIAFIVGKWIAEKRKNLNISKPKKVAWKAQDFSSALIDSF